MEEIYDLRTVLETHAVRLAVPLLMDSDIEELEARLEMTSSWCTSSCGTEAPVSTK